MVGQPYDPRVILRLPPDVPQLELLQPQHLGPGAPREPVGGSTAKATKAHDEILEVELHSQKNVKGER
jgi:hypothetical protein